MKDLAVPCCGRLNAAEVKTRRNKSQYFFYFNLPITQGEFSSSTSLLTEQKDTTLRLKPRLFLDNYELYKQCFSGRSSMHKKCCNPSSTRKDNRINDADQDDAEDSKDNVMCIESSFSYMETKYLVRKNPILSFSIRKSAAESFIPPDIIRIKENEKDTHIYVLIAEVFHADKHFTSAALLKEKDGDNCARWKYDDTKPNLTRTTLFYEQRPRPTLHHLYYVDVLSEQFGNSSLYRWVLNNYKHFTKSPCFPPKS
jgi:hypothetical protein